MANWEKLKSEYKKLVNGLSEKDWQDWKKRYDMKKPIPPYFEYAPHSAKAEDKKIRDWRDEHDPDSPVETQRLYYSGWWILFLSTLSIGCITYLVWQYYPIIAAIGKWIDHLPTWFWCIFTGSCVMAIVLVWRGKKDSKTLK